jgi:hypothetical protein
MRRKSIIKSKREIIERTNERRVLVRFAKDASANAKRASEALNISYGGYRTTVLIFHTCVGVADYMRVAARHGGRFVFFKSSYIGGGIPGIPPKTPKNGQKRRFWVPPQKQGFWGPKCAFGRLSASSFSNFSKKSVFDKRGGTPPRGVPPLGGTPPRGVPPSPTDR